MFSILVIEDDVQVRGFLRGVLEAEGYEVREACDGNVGIKAFRKRRADLVLCDILMPEKEGLQTIRDMHDEFGNVRVMAISGGSKYLAQEDCLRLAMRCGAVATLQKPIGIRALLDGVKEILAA